MSSQPLEVSEDQLKVPRELPVLPLRDIVVYPFIIVPLSVSRERSIRAVRRLCWFRSGPSPIETVSRSCG